jgi:hypothetical protein
MLLEDFIRNILIHPLWTIGATALLWTALFLLFTCFKLSETNWKRLEYVWIFTGFLGLLTIINQNNKELKSYEVSKIKQHIEIDLSHLNFYLSESQLCFKYSKSKFSPPDLVLRQADHDLICSWGKEFIINIDTLEGIPISPLDTSKLKSIKFNTDSMDSYVKEVLQFINQINFNIEKFIEYSDLIKSDIWENFSKSFGQLLLILAFAIRLSIATKSVRATRKKIETTILEKHP